MRMCLPNAPEQCVVRKVPARRVRYMTRMNAPSTMTRLRIAIRAITVWLVLIVAEILHGIARGIFLVPHVGEFRSNQIGVFTGSIIILVIAVVFVRWIGATRPAHLLMVGFLWLAPTLAFEILFGRFVVGASWNASPPTTTC